MPQVQGSLASENIFLSMPRCRRLKYGVDSRGQYGRIITTPTWYHHYKERCTAVTRKASTRNTTPQLHLELAHDSPHFFYISIGNTINGVQNLMDSIESHRMRWGTILTTGYLSLTYVFLLYIRSKRLVYIRSKRIKRFSPDLKHKSVSISGCGRVGNLRNQSKCLRRYLFRS